MSKVICVKLKDDEMKVVKTGGMMSKRKNIDGRIYKITIKEA